MKLWEANSMQNSQKSISHHRTKIILIFLVIVLIWAVAGTAGWAGQFKPLFKQSRVIATLGMAISLTTWPAHELLLELSGKGFGANAPSDLNFISLLFFFVWSAVLWGPILIFLERNIPCWVWLFAQILLLAAVSVLFWKFGNG